jgi:rhamnose transport system substrate-binding protein
MTKKLGKMIVLLVTGSILLTGCNSASRNENEESKTYALITKSQGNPYFELAAQGFQEVIENEGGTCIIASPEEATAEEQISLIRSLISQQVDSIAIAANDTDALQSALTEAMNQGIKVSTMDSNTNADSRMTFVNQASTAKIGQVLMDAVYDITGGEGQWAILSTTAQATNQNSWIEAMQTVMEEDKYSKLSLVNIVYGQDDYETSEEQTKQLLQDYPELKVICAPTVVGIEAVAQVLNQMCTGTKVKVTGLGLPSTMASYISGDNPVCPYMYLWNPMDMGRLSAYVSIALVDGTITGKAGESFYAGGLGENKITDCEDGGTEVIVAPPLRFDPTNINEWKELF